MKKLFLLCAALMCSNIQFASLADGEVEVAEEEVVLHCGEHPGFVPDCPKCHSVFEELEARVCPIPEPGFLASMFSSSSEPNIDPRVSEVLRPLDSAVREASGPVTDLYDPSYTPYGNAIRRVEILEDKLQEHTEKLEQLKRSGCNSRAKDYTECVNGIRSCRLYLKFMRSGLKEVKEDQIDYQDYLSYISLMRQRPRILSSVAFAGDDVDEKIGEVEKQRMEREALRKTFFLEIEMQRKAREHSEQERLNRRLVEARRLQVEREKLQSKVVNRFIKKKFMHRWKALHTSKMRANFLRDMQLKLQTFLKLKKNASDRCQERKLEELCKAEEALKESERVFQLGCNNKLKDRCFNAWKNQTRRGKMIDAKFKSIARVLHRRFLVEQLQERRTALLLHEKEEKERKRAAYWEAHDDRLRADFLKEFNFDMDQLVKEHERMNLVVDCFSKMLAIGRNERFLRGVRNWKAAIGQRRQEAARRAQEEADARRAEAQRQAALELQALARSVLSTHDANTRCAAVRKLQPAVRNMLERNQQRRVQEAEAARRAQEEADTRRAQEEADTRRAQEEADTRRARMRRYGFGGALGAAAVVGSGVFAYQNRDTIRAVGEVTRYFVGPALHDLGRDITRESVRRMSGWCRFMESKLAEMAKSFKK